MLKPIRILLVDDSVPALFGFCHILGQAAGLQVIGQAQEGVYALELIQELLPNVVLVETRLPDVCGMELAAEMRQRGLAARVLAWAQEPSSAADALTAREVQILELLKRGISNQAIARELAVAESTMRFHLRNIYSKLGVKRRGEAIAYALDQGIGAQRLRDTLVARLSLPTGRTSRKR